MTTIRAQRKKLNRLSYGDLFDTLSEKLRHQINERIIWAFTQLTLFDGTAVSGTRGFIEDRGKQLIIDSQIIGFSAASKRFRAAVLRRVNV